MKRVSNTGLLVVTPTLNERDNVRVFAHGLFNSCPEAHLLFVDDNSPDGTGAVLDELCAEDPRIHVLHRVGRLGLGSAYVAGFVWGLSNGYQRIAEMDADLSHDPEDLPKLAAALDAGADLALGSRNVAGGGVRGWGLGRHLLSKGGSAYSRLGLGVPVKDMTTGFKLYSRRALLTIEPLSLRSNGYAFQIETTARALRRGLRVVEVPIVFVDRRVGQSKMNLGICVEAFGFVLRARAKGALGF